MPGGDKSQPSKGNNDYWILKVDANGNKMWDKSFGGNDDNDFTCVKQTSDGGYILGGYSNSPISGDKTQPYHGTGINPYPDYWVLKVDANGNKLWDKTFGGIYVDRLTSLQQTSDGGYILGGSSSSGISSDKSQASKGSADYWIVKLDGNGNKMWDKTFGGSGDDQLSSVQQVSDGGYILGGYSLSGISGDKSQAAKGADDFWIIKLDANGNKTWDKAYGGSSNDHFWSLKQTFDGGYILGGNSSSGISGDKSQPSKGVEDLWVVKIDSSGQKLWDKTFGGNNFEDLSCVTQTSDGGYLLGGETHSSLSGDVSEANRGNIGTPDYWIVKLDVNGNKTWDKILGGMGGTNFDRLYSLQQTFDGGYILGGTSGSGIGGDKSQSKQRGSEFWIVKLAAEGSPKPVDVGVTLISGVESGCQLTSQESITITVKNMGMITQSNIAVSYKINNGAVVIELVTEPVIPNASIRYTFNTKANLSKLGSYAIEARSNHPNDAIPGNDAFIKNITVSSIPAAPAVVISGNPCSNVLTLLASGVPSHGSYIWYNVPFNGIPIHSNSSGVFNVHSLSDSTFFVATQDEFGCEGSRASITVKPCQELFIPNIITPNDDDKNDFFKPQYLPEGKWQLQVFNRWGIEIFESENYQNNWPDKKISDGTYYYLLRNSETGQQYKGWVEVAQ